LSGRNRFDKPASGSADRPVPAHEDRP
jgi:hypothetical protein